MMSFPFTDVNTKEQPGEKGEEHGQGEAQWPRLWGQVHSDSMDPAERSCFLRLPCVSCSIWSDKTLEERFLPATHKGHFLLGKAFWGEVITRFSGPE